MSRVILPLKRNDRVAAFPHLAASITAESNALAATTVANWMNVQGWRTDEDTAYQPTLAKSEQQWYETYPWFDIDIVCDAAETLVSAQLFACRLAPVTIADDTFTASGATLTAISHALLNGDGPVQLTTSDTLPDGLSLLTDYYVEVLSANTFGLHTTRAGAIASDASTVITTTDAGTGTHTLSDVQSSNNADDDSRRFHFALVGDLYDGTSITLTAQTSFHERIKHDPLTLYYVLVATETSTETVTVTVTPLQTGEV